MQYNCWQLQYTRVRLLIYMIEYTVHPSDWSEATEVHAHHGLCSTLDGKYSIPSEAPDLHDRKCSTPKWLKWVSWSTSWPLHYTWWQMQYTLVIEVRLLIYMIGYAAHPSDWSEAPEVHTHHGLCSTLDGKWSTNKWLKWGSWSASCPLQCNWWLM